MGQLIPLHILQSSLNSSNGKSHGAKTFIVPLRHPSTYNLLPGVTIGDIGKKMGRDGIDNGWMQFTNVRIPRSNMLMRHTKVDRDGTVTEPPLQQLTYAPLIFARVYIVVEAAVVLMKSLSISCRYACVRRQFSKKEGEPETKIMDYVIHQHRLLPIMASAFATHFASLRLEEMLLDLMGVLKTAKTPEKMNVLLEDLKEVHSTAAGLKAFMSWSTLESIDACRQACGGHGYSAYVGLAGMYQDFAVHCSWDGDNTILALQTGRYLVQCYRQAVTKGKKLNSKGVDYLNHVKQLSTATCGNDVTDLDSIALGWDVVAARTTATAAKLFEKRMEDGRQMDDALEDCGMTLFVMTV